MDVQIAVRDLVAYALKTGLIEEADIIWALNTVTLELGISEVTATREDVIAELICDGQHVHPSAVRMAFRLFPGRICLISDALRCCGMPDGQYTLGGQDVFLKGGVAKLADGTIAGSAANLYECMQRAVSFGIPG